MAFACAVLLFVLFVDSYGELSTSRIAAVIIIMYATV